MPPQKTVTYRTKKQADGLYKVQRITSDKNGTRKSTVASDLPADAADEQVFLRERNIFKKPKF